MHERIENIVAMVASKYTLTKQGKYQYLLFSYGERTYKAYGDGRLYRHLDGLYLGVFDSMGELKSRLNRG